MTLKSKRPSIKNRKVRPQDSNRATRLHLAKIKPFIEEARKSNRTTDTLLITCIKASLVKAYEFSRYAHESLDNNSAFHCIGGLRSICEDLIIMKFVNGLRLEDQETALHGNMIQSVDESICRQVPFFYLFRPGQPVLNRSFSAEALTEIRNKLIVLWQTNGWPSKTDPKWPPTEQIASKIGPGTLDVVYNYIYRLTSGTVHFSTRALLRTGWGPNKNDFSFSTANMSVYYEQFCRVYSVFLLTIYFEFFEGALCFDKAVARHVEKLRHSLIMQGRWPEMITFEEMNIEVPQAGPFSLAFQKIAASELEKGFISGAERYQGST